MGIDHNAITDECSTPLATIRTPVVCATHSTIQGPCYPIDNPMNERYSTAVGVACCEVSF